jgi:hypothetical protein
MSTNMNGPFQGDENLCVDVFCTGENRVVKITRSSSEMVLRTIKHTMIYPGLGPALEAIVLRSTV